MSIATWHSTAALAWLQTLLQERFGHLFELQVQPDGNCITMQLSGDTRCVTDRKSVV